MNLQPGQGRLHGAWLLEMEFRESSGVDFHRSGLPV